MCNNICKRAYVQNNNNKLLKKIDFIIFLLQICLIFLKNFHKIDNNTQ